MERRNRFSQWLRRRVRTGAGGDAEGTGGGAAHDREDLLLAAADAGFPLALAAHPSGYGCSCVRIGCPTPGRHPVSFAWQTQATTDREQVRRWARNQPEANFVTSTGRTHDVLDVPWEAGRMALERLDAEGTPTGPVAASEGLRILFFTATRGTPEDEDEWWPCELDCHPETMDEHPGLRWHCRGSYVLVPPAVLPGDGPESGVRWLRPPPAGEEGLLPEPLTLLEALTDACAAYAEERPDHDATVWPVR